MTSLTEETGVVLHAEVSAARAWNHATQHDAELFPVPNARNSVEHPLGQVAAVGRGIDKQEGNMLVGALSEE